MYTLLRPCRARLIEQDCKSLLGEMTAWGYCDCAPLALPEALEKHSPSSRLCLSLYLSLAVMTAPIGAKWLYLSAKQRLTSCLPV